jgi:pyrroline-5-carboxylate reductase
VGIIGVGNMGEAVLAGLIKAGVSRELISFSVRSPERKAEVEKKYQVKSASNTAVAKESDILLLAVKPQGLDDLLAEIASEVSPQAVVVSFLAGKKTSVLEAALDSMQSVIRVMPNTPMMFGEGMSIISAGKKVQESDLDYLREVLLACGKVIEVSEELQDATAATSGSGPAYFFAFVEAMVSGAVKMGISEKVATELVTQTIIGSAKMLAESGKSASTLRENVTSPKGMTAEALAVFNEGKLQELVARAMQAAADRSRELA